MKTITVSLRLFLLACGVPVLIGAGALPALASGPEGATAVAVLEVERLGKVVQFPQYEAFAQVLSLNAARLAAEAPGVVRQWHADVGSRVGPGDLLLSLDPRDAQLALDQAKAAAEAAQARLTLAQAQYQRAEGLVAQGFFSQEALLQRATERTLAQSELLAARAQESLAARALEKMVLRAPFAGVILERHAQVGETVAPGSVVFVLSDPLSVEVEARLAAEQVQSLRGARGVSFQWASGTAELRLLRFSAVASLPSRTQVVRLGISAGPRPASGVTGQLRWKGDQPVVPAGLVVRRPQGLGIFVLIPAPQGYSARFVPMPEAEEGRPVLLARAAGVRDDSLVVVTGQNSLQDGQRIEAARVRVPPPRESRQ